MWTRCFNKGSFLFIYYVWSEAHHESDMFAYLWRSPRLIGNSVLYWFLNPIIDFLFRIQCTKQWIILIKKKRFCLYFIRILNAPCLLRVWSEKRYDAQVIQVNKDQALVTRNLLCVVFFLCNFPLVLQITALLWYQSDHQVHLSKSKIFSVNASEHLSDQRQVIK